MGTEAGVGEGSGVSPPGLLDSGDLDGSRGSEPESGAGGSSGKRAALLPHPCPRPPHAPHLPPQLIYMYWMNTVVNYCGPFEYEVGYCERLKNFLEANLEWMQKEMELNNGSAYWHQVRLTLLQLKGLEDSYEGSVTFPTGKFTIKPLGFL